MIASWAWARAWEVQCQDRLLKDFSMPTHVIVSEVMLLGCSMTCRPSEESGLPIDVELLLNFLGVPSL